MLKTRRHCVRTMVSHAAWSPSRQRWMTWSIACAEDESKDTEPAHDNMRTLVYAPYSQGKHGLACDGVALAPIARDVGTPVFVYSAHAIREAYLGIDRAFDGYPHAIHYALKANSTLALLRVLRALGSRADANSEGEIRVAFRAGFSPAEVVFTGV